MLLFPPTIILRHRRENLKKCSLRGLENREDALFFAYPGREIPKVENYILLTLDAPPLTIEDKEHGLFLIDGTWRLAQTMENFVTSQITFIPRSIPSGFVTAYPRRQADCIDPTRGLASVEALFIAYLTLGRSTGGLLDHYYWKDVFFERNALLKSDSQIVFQSK